MSWHPYPPAGLTMVSGADFSANTHYVYPAEIIFCPGDPPFIPDAHIPWIAPGLSFSTSDSYAADHIAALATYELVQIYTVGTSLGGVEGGWIDCASYRHGDPFLSAQYSGVTVSGGPSGELRSGDDGTLLPILNPTQPNWSPLVAGLFMRPTALEWDGQNPAEDANRSVWLPSEVIGVLGSVSLAHSMANAAGYDTSFGTGVRALNVISGTPRLPGTSVEQPVICFV